MIYQKLLDIQKLGLKFEKRAKNPFFKSTYLSLDDMLNQLLPILNEHEIGINHYIRDGALVTEVFDPKDVFLSQTGIDKISSIFSSFPLPQGVDPQKLGSAITYGKRYNLGAIFNVVTDEDDDGNSSSKADTNDTEEVLPF